MPNRQRRSRPARTATIALAVLGGAALAAAGLAAGGAWHWNRQTRRAVAALHATADLRAPSEPQRFEPGLLDGLPVPVARYFEFAITPGRPLVRGARIVHRGEFRTSPEGPWAPFHSVEHFTAAPPGFVWDASIRMMPLLGVRVRDSYIAGTGAMLGRVGAVLTVVDQRATPELSAGALHRWLAELAWLPTALLPGQGVEWTPIDETSATATVADAGTRVSLTVRFDPEGGIAEVSGERYRDVDGVPIPTPWRGRFHNYAMVDGMRIPLSGEVAWLLPEGPFTYWRGDVESAVYD